MGLLQVQLHQRENQVAQLQQQVCIDCVGRVTPSRAAPAGNSEKQMWAKSYCPAQPVISQSLEQRSTHWAAAICSACWYELCVQLNRGSFGAIVRPSAV
jgi:hypothetical protein